VGLFLFVQNYTTAYWLPDGNGKHGEALCAALCRICNEQPELLLKNELLLKAHYFNH
jgi:hypothetical protein